MLAVRRKPNQPNSISHPLELPVHYNRQIDQVSQQRDPCTLLIHTAVTNSVDCCSTVCCCCTSRHGSHPATLLFEETNWHFCAVRGYHNNNTHISLVCPFDPSAIPSPCRRDYYRTCHICIILRAKCVLSDIFSTISHNSSRMVTPALCIANYSPWNSWLSRISHLASACWRGPQDRQTQAALTTDSPPTAHGSPMVRFYRVLGLRRCCIPPGKTVGQTC